MSLDAWGRGLDVLDLSQSHVDRYCQLHRSLEVVAPGLRLNEDGSRPVGYREPKPVQDGALDAEFRWLASALNFAVQHRASGHRLLAENPLKGLQTPKEKNPRRPVASHQRYMATIEHADTVDPDGRFRCILALARFTGRRESAIYQVGASDLLLSADRVGRALAEAGMDERLAEHMPHGAIRWAAGSDKQGLLFVSPISRQAREEVERYLQKNPRVGDVPLFPSPADAERPISREMAAKWLARAEKLAGVPKLKGGAFHPYRRLWASERKHMPDVDVAAAGGWKDTQALRLSYQHADPATVLRVVEGA